MKLSLTLIVIFVVVVSIDSAKSSNAYAFFFSNKSYSKNITIESRITSASKLYQLISNQEKNLEAIPKESIKELNQKKTYLFVRLKNRGNMGAWGRLTCTLNSGREIPIHVPFLTTNMPYWNHYIFSTSGIQFYKNKNADHPDVSCEWDKLYSK
jgi:hypothetical protein